MGEPVKIVDLARDVITLSGLRPGVDIDIEITGLRPGEKLFEELSVHDENADKTRHPKIFVGRLRHVDYATLRLGMDELARHVDDVDPTTLLARIRALVPEYVTPAPTGPGTPYVPPEAQALPIAAAAVAPPPA
jgi:FlaA1/EpsC-like NDP-sugar epimerase